MSLLRFAEQTRKPAEFADELPKVRTNATELRLAKRLIADSTVDEVDWSDYTDGFRDRVQAIIDRKIKGEETIDLGEDEEAAPTINLMDALKKSLGEGKRSGSAKASHAKTVSIRMPHAASRKRKPAAKTKAKRATTKRRKVS
jgi:DNA end-binding protein Ku